MARTAAIPVTAADAAEAFFHLTHDLLAALDQDGRIVIANPAWQETLGLVEADVIGRRLGDLVDGGDREKAEQLVTSAIGASAASLELRMIGRDGQARRVRWRGRVGGAGHIELAGQDLTHSAASETALRRMMRRYRSLFSSHPLPMLVWELQSGRILAVNAAAVQQYGYRRDEFVSISLDRIVHADDRHAQVEHLTITADGAARGRVFRHRRKNGSELEVEVIGHEMEYAGRPCWVLMATDVTERRQLEEQLREAGKMEAIGRLAGGIAHDFNNLLTAINGYSQLLRASLSTDDPRHEDARQIMLAGERAAALTSQLLAFSRRQLLQPEVLDINAVVLDLAPMVQRLIGAHIELRLALRSRPLLVLADRARLEQVVLNLCLNACDAMPTGGQLTLQSATAEWLEPRQMGQELAGAGRYVELRVRDTGVGMDAATRRKIFEPFFTTKGPGRGTGLGLATAHGTVRQSGGHMRVTSAIGKGTSFRVYLPLAEAAAGLLAPPSGPAAGEPALAKGTILIVEDEPTVRSLGLRVLGDAGYRVLVADDTASALAAARGEEGAISLLLTDLVIPGGGGADLARRVLELRPGTPVLYMSGYAEDAIVHGGVVDPEVEFLAKPFTASELLARVRALLATPKRSAPQGSIRPGHDVRQLPADRIAG